MANSPEVDFALVLAGTIDAIKNNPSLLRNTVYELARTKLAMFAREQNPRMTVLELRRMLRSFETAIEHVESHASRQDELLPLPGTTDFVAPAHLVNRNRGDPVFIPDQRVDASKIVDFPNSSSYSHGVLRAGKPGRNWPCPTPVLAAAFRNVEAATLADERVFPDYPNHLSDVPCPLPRRIERVRVLPTLIGTFPK